MNLIKTSYERAVAILLAVALVVGFAIVDNYRTVSIKNTEINNTIINLQREIVKTSGGIVRTGVISDSEIINKILRLHSGIDRYILSKTILAILALAVATILAGRFIRWRYLG